MTKHTARPRYRGCRACSFLGLTFAGTPFLGLALAACSASASAPPPQASPQEPVASAAPAPLRQLSYTLVARYPHDPTAFTEGLFLQGDTLFESTGFEGRSVIRATNLADGKLLRERAIDATLFGEGIAPWGDEIVSMTWRGGRGFRWGLADFAPRGTWFYAGEGWGMTAGPDALVTSDGTPDLRFLDPNTLAETRRVAVTFDGQPLANINELEWIDGAVFANVWTTNLIVRIDPASGVVTGWFDIAALAAEAGADASVRTPNGIAWDAKRKLLLVTGKYWPTIFAIRLAETAG